MSRSSCIHLRKGSPNPYGHIGIGVNTPQTEGFYPDIDLPAYPGHILPDTLPPIKCMIIHTSPDQDKNIQDFINSRKKTPVVRKNSIWLPSDRDVDTCFFGLPALENLRS